MNGANSIHPLIKQSKIHQLVTSTKRKQMKLSQLLITSTPEMIWWVTSIPAVMEQVAN